MTCKDCYRHTRQCFIDDYENSENVEKDCRYFKAENVKDALITRAKEIIKDLHSYCFLTQPTYRKMGYSFNEGDFERFNELIDEINRQQAEIELLQKRVKYGNDLSDYVIRGAKKKQ